MAGPNTREGKCYNELTASLAASAGWNIVSPQLQHIPRTNTDSFQLYLGTTQYLTYNGSNQPLTCQQAFTLVVTINRTRNLTSYWIDQRTSIVNFIEAFFRTYAPPAPIPGDTAQIDYIKLDTIKGDEPSSIESHTFKIAATGYFHCTLI